MRTGKTIKCSKCGFPVKTKWVDIQINTTTPFSEWRVDEVADCVECGEYQIIEKGVE